MAKPFLVSEGDKQTFHPPQKVHIGKVVSAISSAKGLVYHVKYEDGDEEEMSQSEFDNSKVTSTRADELRPVSNPAPGRTPSLPELKKKDLTAVSSIGACVKETRSSKLNNVGVVVGYTGRTHGTRYAVMWADGTKTTRGKKDLSIMGSRVVADSSLEAAATVTMKGSSACSLGVYVDGVPSVLVRDDGVTWRTTPFNTLSGTTSTYSREQLCSDISDGTIQWFTPQLLVSTNQVGNTADVRVSSASPAVSWQAVVSTDDLESDLDTDDDESIEGEKSERTHSVRDPYCSRAIIDALIRWPTIHCLGVSSTNTRAIPGSGFVFRKVTDPIAANGGGSRAPNVDLFRAPSWFGCFDPFVQYPAETPSFSRLKCPFCECTGHVTSKGWNNGAKRCYEVNEVVPMATRRLRCNDCPKAKAGKKERCFTLLHPYVVAQFDPTLRAKLPVTVGSVLFSKTLGDLIIELRAAGTSFSAIHKILVGLYNSAHTQKWHEYLLACNGWQQSLAGDFTAFKAGDFGKFGEHGERAPSVGKIREYYLAECSRRKRTQLQYICSLKGEVLKADHTFWATKAIAQEHVRLFMSLYGIMNEHGQICFWAFAKSKSSHALAANLEAFGERYKDDTLDANGPKVFYVDNPSEVREFLKNGNKGGSFGGFGDSLLVLHDPFHMLYNIGNALVKKHPLAAKFTGSLRVCFLF